MPKSLWAASAGIKKSGAVQGETSVYAKRQDGNGGRVERDRREKKRCKRSQESPDAATADPGCEGREQHVESLRDKRGAEGCNHQAAEGR